MLAVTLADLWFRARQFLIAIIGVGLVLAVALAVTGLADGFHAEVENFVDSVGGSSWVMSSAAQGRITAFAAFPETDAAAVGHQPGVHRASPLMFAPSQVVHLDDSSTPQTVNLVGVVPGGLGAPHVVSGHGLSGPGQAVVDSKVTNQVGSILVLGGHSYQVVGIVDGATMLGGQPLVYMPIATVQQAVTGGRPLATAVVVEGSPPANLPHGLVVLAPTTVVTDTMGQLKSAVASINSTRWLMWIIAAVIVAAMLYVAALERKRDFAVLKALGSSSRALFLSLVLEAVIVTLLAALLAEVLASLLTPTFAQPIDITLDARLVLPVVAVVVGIVASVSALRRVTGADPRGGVRVNERLVVDQLTVAFDSGGYVIKPLDGLSFAAEDGELVVLLGPSGCGKTTLLSCIAGLLTPTSGNIRYGPLVVNDMRGPALSDYRRKTVGVVFQAFNLIPSLTARGNVLVPMRITGMPRAQAKARADELLEQVGLDERGHHRPAQLSGGQQQRVAIARALVHDPPLIVADEPTAHLDHIQVEGILRLLRQLASPGRIVVVSTHDDRVTQLADRVVEMAPHFTDADRPPEEAKVAAGEILFRQGERGELIYHIDSGLLEVYRELADGSNDVLARIEPGNYVGELGPILNLPRSASVRALEDTVVTGYTVRAFRKVHPHQVVEQSAV